MRTVSIAVGMFLVAAFAVSWAQEPAQVEVVDPGPTTVSGGYPGHEGHQRVNHDILMRNDLVAYQVRYCACVDKSHQPEVVPLEGYIGMPLPTSCNWYHSGFLRVIVNGEDIGKYPLSDFCALDTGARGMCRMVWDYPGGRVRISFVLEPNSNHLKTQILLNLNDIPKSVAVVLSCYPSFFTAHFKRQGARRIITPASDIKEGQNLTVPAADNWWALYQDEVFDVARGEGEGPCAMLFVPAQAQTVQFAPGGYAVSTTIAFKPDQHDIRLAFWDFKGMSNADALKSLRSNAAQVMADLLNTRFAPLIVEQTDLAAERKQLEQLCAKIGATDLAQEQRKLLNEAEEALAAARQGDWQSEKKLADLVTKYRNALWELKIQALFTD